MYAAGSSSTFDIVLVVIRTVRQTRMQARAGPPVGPGFWSLFEAGWKLPCHHTSCHVLALSTEMLWASADVVGSSDAAWASETLCGEAKLRGLPKPCGARRSCAVRPRNDIPRTISCAFSYSSLSISLYLGPSLSISVCLSLSLCFSPSHSLGVGGVVPFGRAFFARMHFTVARATGRAWVFKTRARFGSKFSNREEEWGQFDVRVWGLSCFEVRVDLRVSAGVRDSGCAMLTSKVVNRACSCRRWVCEFWFRSL